MRINNNIMAMNTHRQYGINNNNVAKSVEKLSSGYRINRAGDDAAGLAISEKMRAQIRGLNMASKNSQDAISLVQTAEGALQETHNILQRMRELAVQSASDTNETTIDRNALNKEFQQLIDEIDDTANKTKFNEMGLINGNFAKYKVALAEIAGGSATVHAQALTLNATGSTTADFNITLSPLPATAKAPTVSLTAGGGAVNLSANFTFNNAIGAQYNGETFSIDQSSNTLSLTLGSTTYTASVTGDLVSGGSMALTFTSGAEILGTLNITNNGSTITGQNVVAAAIADLDGAVGNNGFDDQVEITDASGNKYVLQAGQTKLHFDNGVALEFDPILADFSNIADIFSTKNGTVTVSVTLEENQDFVVQTGANKGDALHININNMDSKTLGVWISNIADRESSSNAIKEVNSAINRVSTQRAALGALQNRLEHKIANLDTSAENLQAAESRIRDLDMAKEMTAFTKNNILSQAATAMLAQANSLPQGVLQLLQ